MCVQSGNRYGCRLMSRWSNSFQSHTGLWFWSRSINHVSGYRRSGDDLLGRRKHDQVPVRKHHKIVMRPNDCDIASSAGCCRQRFVEVCGRHLPNELSSQVHLLQDGIRAIRRLTTEIDQEMPVRQQLDWIRPRPRLKPWVVSSTEYCRPNRYTATGQQSARRPNPTVPPHSAVSCPPSLSPLSPALVLLGTRPW